MVAVNLMSSPGSGKTTLLERTVRDLGAQLPIGVLEGDQETRLDAERIGATGVPAVQINTGAGCHLDADMVDAGLRALAPEPGALVFVENVGNLVCPALFDLGERARVVIMSVTEGADKPLKYPHMFRTADLMLVNKVDLLPYVDFDVARCVDYARRARPDVPVIEISATRGDGLEPGTPGCTSSEPPPRDERNRGSVGREPRFRSPRAHGEQAGHRVRGALRGEQDVGGLEAHRFPAEFGHADVAVVVGTAPGPVELLAVVLDGQPRPRIGEVESGQHEPVAVQQFVLDVGRGQAVVLEQQPQPGLHG